MTEFFVMGSILAAAVVLMIVPSLIWEAFKVLTKQKESDNPNT